MPGAWQAAGAALHLVIAPLRAGMGSGGGGSGDSGAAAARIIDAAASAREVRENLPLALLLSVLAGGSTGLGGLLMVAQTDCSARRLGLWQGAAAGFMISVSLFDMLPTVLESLSPAAAAFYLALGACLFLALQRLIPEPSLDNYIRALAPAASKSVSSIDNLGVAELAQAEGLQREQGGSGGTALNDEYARAHLPHNQKASRAVLWSGLVTAFGISLHNFPEGIAVCIASVRGLRFGLPLAAVIAIHNLPEGAAVALPVYFATRDKSYAVRLAFLSGMAEPLGVVCMAAVVYATDVVLTKALLAVMLAVVAGVMLVICATELIPHASTHAGTRSAAVSTIGGLMAMSLTLSFIDWTAIGAP